MSYCRESVSTVSLPRPEPSRLHALTSPYRVIFSRELDLILACCGDDSDGELSARIQYILREPNDLNWERLLQLAEHHGLVPLTYRRLSMTMDANQFVWLETFRQQNQINAHRTMGLTIELFNIHKHLAARRLETLPYKGPALAQSLYGNIALRQFSDLDLLVRADDLPAIRSALAELGYRPGIHLMQAAERAYLKSGYEYTFDGAEGRNLIEIKWQILPRFYSIGFDVEGLFERAVEVDVGGRRLPTLCDQDLMLVLCVHAAKHAWTQLCSLRDIAQLARSRALDWDALWMQAKRLGIARIVAVSFLLADKLLGTALLVQLGAQSDPVVDALAQRILRRIIADGGFDPESVGYFRLMMDLRERLRDRVSFLWRLWVTPGAGEWSAIRLPSSLFPLYRVVRMFRLAGRVLS